MTCASGGSRMPAAGAAPAGSVHPRTHDRELRLFHRSFSSIRCERVRFEFWGVRRDPQNYIIEALCDVHEQLWHMEGKTSIYGNICQWWVGETGCRSSTSGLSPPPHPPQRSMTVRPQFLVDPCERVRWECWNARRDIEKTKFFGIGWAGSKYSVDGFGLDLFRHCSTRPTDVNSGCHVSIHFWCFTYFY